MLVSYIFPLISPWYQYPIRLFEKSMYHVKERQEVIAAAPASVFHSSWDPTETVEGSCKAIKLQPNDMKLMIISCRVAMVYYVYSYWLDPTLSRKDSPHSGSGFKNFADNPWLWRMLQSPTAVTWATGGPRIQRLTPAGIHGKDWLEQRNATAIRLIWGFLK